MSLPTLDHNKNNCGDCGLPVDIRFGGPSSEVSGQFYLLCIRRVQHRSDAKWWHVFDRLPANYPLSDFLHRAMEKTPSPMIPPAPTFAALPPASSQLTPSASAPPRLTAPFAALLKMVCTAIACPQVRLNQKCPRKMCAGHCVEAGGCVVHRRETVSEQSLLRAQKRRAQEPQPPWQLRSLSPASHTYLNTVGSTLTGAIVEMQAEVQKSQRVHRERVGLEPWMDTTYGPLLPEPVHTTSSADADWDRAEVHAAITASLLSHPAKTYQQPNMSSSSISLPSSSTSLPSSFTSIPSSFTSLPSSSTSTAQTHLSALYPAFPRSPSAPVDRLPPLPKAPAKKPRHTTQMHPAWHEELRTNHIAEAKVASVESEAKARKLAKVRRFTLVFWGC